jgi:hypothetical protein
MKAGLPGCGEITNRVLKAEGIFRHTDGNYYEGVATNPGIDRTRAYLDRIRLLLQMLRTEADLYYFGDRAPNYEDLYFMAYQVWASLVGELDNPAIQPLIQVLNDKLGKVMEGDPLEHKAVRKSGFHWYEHSIAKLVGLSGECCKYINNFLVSMLSKSPTDLGYLSWVADAAADVDFEKKILFTLNYDLLLETLFQDRHLSCIDGFRQSSSDDGVRGWSPEEWRRTDALKLVKLHGSLNWFLGQPKQAGEKWRVFAVQEPERARAEYDLSSPLVLVGTHNKPLEYTNFFFEELHHQMSIGLKAVDRLVVCGYGFGDKAINARLLHWLTLSPEKRILVVHPDPNACRDAARAAVYRAWSGLVDSGVWRVIPRKSEDVSWSEIKQLLG